MQRNTERSAAAQRMARYRRRLREGLHSIRIDLRAAEVDALIARGLLQPDQKDKSAAITRALGRFLDRSLGRP